MRQPNRGVASAMNAGIKASTGEFVLTLGADDLLHPEYVQAMLEALHASPGASFAYSRIRFFGARECEFPTEAFDPETLAQRNYVAAVALFRRSAFDLLGGFDASVPRCEDWDFWLGLAERGHYGVYVPRVLAFGRQHGRSYNSRDFASWSGVRRELLMAERLRRKHSTLFAPRALLRRLRRLPGRLLRRDVSPHFAALLFAFYGWMLVGSVVDRMRSQRSGQP
jgi:glycosyltransferase involved in cell wall biosynthesis